MVATTGWLVTKIISEGDSTDAQPSIISADQLDANVIASEKTDTIQPLSSWNCPTRDGFQTDFRVEDQLVPKSWSWRYNTGDEFCTAHTDKVLCRNTITGSFAETDWSGSGVGEDAYRSYTDCFDLLRLQESQ